MEDMFDVLAHRVGEEDANTHFEDDDADGEENSIGV
jgi:hypothetical protein